MENSLDEDEYNAYVHISQYKSKGFFRENVLAFLRRK